MKNIKIIKTKAIQKVPLKTNEKEITLDKNIKKKILSKVTKPIILNRPKKIQIKSDQDILDKKIDIVITYVDSTNAEWQELFNSSVNKDKNNSSKSITKNRFRNNDELKYCLRSIDKYLNFYRNIYIVMNHSPPTWLNLNHPQIKIIRHEEIPDLNENLPTFNSQAIECNLHKIPNLSSEFLYFNDDMFINAPLDKSFFRNSKVNIFSTKIIAPNGNPHKNLTGYYNAWINSNKLLDKNYRPQTRYLIDHCPYYVIKKVAIELENKFKTQYINTTKSKFRQINNINPLCSILQYHYYYKRSGNFVKDKVSKTIFITDSFENNIKKLIILDKVNPKMFCIEDNMIMDKEENIKLIKDFLIKKFPDKSQFEI